MREVSFVAIECVCKSSVCCRRISREREELLDVECSTCLGIVRHIHASEQKVVEGMCSVLGSIGDCLHLPIQITI